MAHLNAKSEFNLDAAKVLIDEHDYFAPSIHCSYYGCFQFIKSKLNQLGITYEKINSDIAASRQPNVRTLNSHDYPISLLVDKIEEKSGPRQKKVVWDKIRLLKKSREESDYHNVTITYHKGVEALKLSKEIIRLINEKL